MFPIRHLALSTQKLNISPKAWLNTIAQQHPANLTNTRFLS